MDNRIPARRVRTLAIGAGAVAALAAGGVGIAVAAPSAGGGSSTSRTATGGSPPTGTPAAPKHTPHLDGTVTSADGSTILIKDPDGFTRTIKTSSATRYTDGLHATPRTGTRIHADGTVDADGTSLDATTIGAAPAGGPGGRPGGPGGRPPAGPGAPGGSGPAGSGSSASGSSASAPAGSGTGTGAGSGGSRRPAPPSAAPSSGSS